MFVGILFCGNFFRILKKIEKLRPPKIQCMAHGSPLRTLSFVYIILRELFSDTEKYRKNRKNKNPQKFSAWHTVASFVRCHLV